MNCHEAQQTIFAERDGALASDQGAALARHTETCASCGRLQADLEGVVLAWRHEAARVTVPDAEREWHAVRRRIRGGAAAGTVTALRPRRNFMPWLAVPVGAAAALALAFFAVPQLRRSGGSLPVVEHTARADSVAAPGDRASTMLMVDEKSGWLFVWATDAAPKSG